MKKILVLFLLLFAVQAQAAGIYTTVASGTVASADIAVTLTAGSANVDLSSATIPRNYKGHLIRIYDANNVMIQGYVYTDGAGTVQNIVNTKGGTTRNWASQGAGFDDTTNCRYEIIKVRQLPVIATHSITAGNALIDATDANAFAAPVGVDLSAYQDGQHMLAMYDSSGYAAIAHISATAPAGETLGENIVADLNFTSGWVASNCTITSANSFVNTNGGTAYVVKTITNIGALYKSDFIATVSSGIARLGGNGIIPLYGNNGASGVYATAINVSLLVLNLSGSGSGTLTVDTLNMQKVTMPAATGVLLLSRKGGSRGWLYKHASFNPNAAITAKILYVGD
jgi:hypothetical protein